MKILWRRTKEPIGKRCHASDLGEEWFDFITKLENCYKRKARKTDPVAIECATFWKKVTSFLTGADEQLQKSIQNL